MSRYIDFFVIPVPKKKYKAYLAIAKLSAKVWMKAGALEYVETITDDVSKGKTTSFPRSVKLKAGEQVAVGYIVYKSRAHRDQVMKKIHQDEKLMAAWEDIPFDGMRMIWGGFKTIVSA